jgi:hypothetical protein
MRDAKQPRPGDWLGFFCGGGPARASEGWKLGLDPGEKRAGAAGPSGLAEEGISHSFTDPRRWLN